VRVLGWSCEVGWTGYFRRRLTAR